MANEKHSKNITLRGNVAKSTVIFSFYHSDFYYSKLIILMNLKSFCCLLYGKGLLRVLYWILV